MKPANATPHPDNPTPRNRRRTWQDAWRTITTFDYLATNPRTIRRARHRRPRRR